MTPWPLSVEMDAAALVYVPYDHVCSPATPIRPIRPHTKDLLYGLCLLGVSGARCGHLGSRRVAFFSGTAYSHVDLSIRAHSPQCAECAHVLRSAWVPADRR